MSYLQRVLNILLSSRLLCVCMHALHMAACVGVGNAPTEGLFSTIPTAPRQPSNVCYIAPRTLGTGYPMDPIHTYIIHTHTVKRDVQLEIRTATENTSMLHSAYILHSAYECTAYCTVLMQDGVCVCV